MKKIFSICIIDDDPIFVYITRRLMKECSFCDHIDVYDNGQKALNNLQKRELSEKNRFYDIIFLDLSMPIMSGWEFLDAFNKQAKSIKSTFKIVVMSSSVDPNEIEMIKKYSLVTDYIVKPITPADLQNLLA